MSTRDSRPLVLLFGWGGATERLLRRYELIYERAGYATIAYISQFIVPWSLQTTRRWAVDFVQKANLESEGGRPLLIHAFSMTGITTFWALWELLEKRPFGARIKRQVRGIVFDRQAAGRKGVNATLDFSGPTRITSPRIAAEAVANGHYPPSMRDLSSSFLRAGTRTAVFFWYALVRLRLLVNSGSIDDTCAFHRLSLRVDLPANQLFLYSKADPLIDYRNVEEFAEIQRKAGVRVETKRWEESGHIQHYAHDPREYERLCLQFASRLLRDERAKL
ncbi:Transmembrane protein 53 [Aphelenchoides fujianensis]|nr:Transmembrane protein 53 [Aphelenchoides fujianensis]